MSVHIWPRPIFLARAGASDSLGDITQFKDLAAYTDEKFSTRKRRLDRRSKKKKGDESDDEKISTYLLKKLEMEALDITMAASLNPEGRLFATRLAEFMRKKMDIYIEQRMKPRHTRPDDESEHERVSTHYEENGNYDHNDNLNHLNHNEDNNDGLVSPKSENETVDGNDSNNSEKRTHPFSFERDSTQLKSSVTSEQKLHPPSSHRNTKSRTNAHSLSSLHSPPFRPSDPASTKANLYGSTCTTKHTPKHTGTKKRRESGNTSGSLRAPVMVSCYPNLAEPEPLCMDRGRSSSDMSEFSAVSAASGVDGADVDIHLTLRERRGGKKLSRSSSRSRVMNNSLPNSLANSRNNSYQKLCSLSSSKRSSPTLTGLTGFPPPQLCSSSSPLSSSPSNSPTQSSIQATTPLTSPNHFSINVNTNDDIITKIISLNVDDEKEDDLETEKTGVNVNMDNEMEEKGDEEDLYLATPKALQNRFTTHMKVHHQERNTRELLRSEISRHITRVNAPDHTLLVIAGAEVTPEISPAISPEFPSFAHASSPALQSLTGPSSSSLSSSSSSSSSLSSSSSSSSSFARTAHVIQSPNISPYPESHDTESMHRSSSMPTELCNTDIDRHMITDNANTDSFNRDRSVEGRHSSMKMPHLTLNENNVADADFMMEACTSISHSCSLDDINEAEANKDRGKQKRVKKSKAKMKKNSLSTSHTDLKSKEKEQSNKLHTHGRSKSLTCRSMQKSNSASSTIDIDSTSVSPSPTRSGGVERLRSRTNDSLSTTPILSHIDSSPSTDTDTEMELAVDVELQESPSAPASPYSPSSTAIAMNKTPKGTRPLMVFSSTHQRALDTAHNIVKDVHPIHCEALSSLNILFPGRIYGMSSEDVEKNLPARLKEWHNNKYRTRFPGGESMHDKALSLEPLVMELERQVLPCLVLSHSSTLQVLYGYFLGMKCKTENYPSLDIERNIVIELTPSQYGWVETRHFIMEPGRAPETRHHGLSFYGGGKKIAKKEPVQPELTLSL